MKTLFNTLSETNYDILNQKQFLFQNSPDKPTQSVDKKQEGNEKIKNAIDNSKKKQINCKRECLEKVLPNLKKMVSKGESELL